MTSDKYLKIITTHKSGSIASRCQDILEKVGKDHLVLGIVFFFDAEGKEGYLEGEAAMVSCCKVYFGKAAPMVTCVAQKPVGTTLTAEVLYLRGDGTVEFNDDYLVIRNQEGSELVSKGIHFPYEGDTAVQAGKVIGRLSEILEGEGISGTHINLSMVKPVPAKELIDLIGSSKDVFTLEEGILSGGVGEDIHVQLHRNGWNHNVVSIAVEDPVIKASSPDDQLKTAGLDGASVAGKIKASLGKV